MKKYLVFSGIGIELIALVWLALILGREVDKFFGTQGIFFLIFMLLFLVGWIVQIIIMLKKIENKGESSGQKQ